MGDREGGGSRVLRSRTGLPWRAFEVVRGLVPAAKGTG